MSDDDTKEVDGAAGEESGGKTKKLLLIIIPILLIGVGAGLYFTGTLDSLLGKDKAEAGAEGGEKAEAGAHGEGKDGAHGAASTAAFLDIPDIIVNLQSDDQPHFLRLKVKLELKNEKDLAAVETVVPRVIDQFQTFLREMRMQDLRGTAGIYRLRQELLYRVNIASKPVVVQDVLFQEILVQ